MAAKTDRVGLVIGADASNFTRSMRDISREAERVGRILGQGKRTGIFSPADLQEYDSALIKVQKNLSRVSNEYKRVSGEAGRFKTELDNIERGGGRVSGGQREQLASLQAHVRTTGYQRAQAQEDAQGMQGHRGGIQAGVNKGRRRTAGKVVMGGAAAVGMYGIATAMAGLQTIIQREAGNALTAALEGFGKRGSMVGAGLRYGMDPAQAQQLYASTMQATGRTGTKGAISNLRMSRGFGVDTSNLLGMQKGFRQAGGDDPANVLNDALLRALKKGNVPTVLMGEFADAASSVFGTMAGSREKITSSQTVGLLGALSRAMGPAYQKAPGRTAGLVSGLHQTISSQAMGGSDASRAFMLRSVGFGSDPKMSYFKAIERMEEGGTPRNIRAMLAQNRRETGGASKEMQMLRLYTLGKGSIKAHQARKLVDMDPSAISQDRIDEIMSSQLPNVKKKASRGAGVMKYTRAELVRQQERVNVAKAASKMIDIWQKGQIKLIKVAAGAAQALIDLEKATRAAAAALARKPVVIQQSPGVITPKNSKRNTRSFNKAMGGGQF